MYIFHSVRFELRGSAARARRTWRTERAPGIKYGML